jgi:Ca2+-binding EF-hand superfamily protein
MSVDTSPVNNHMVCGTEKGKVLLYNYKTRDVLLGRVVGDCSITNIRFNMSGTEVVVGTSRGELLILDPLTLDLRQRLEHARASIKHICFTNDKIAHSDMEMSVCLYKRSEETDKLTQWRYVGKSTSHYKQINDIMFDKSGRVLLSIGEDRILVQYDVEVIVEMKLKVISWTRLEQSAVPLCFTWYPSFSEDNQLLMSNSEYKLKLYNQQLSCCKTTLGPTADEPIKLFYLLSSNLDNYRKRGYMVYATKKFIGVKLIPATGNPYEHMSIIGHSRNIRSIRLSYDEKYLFTIGCEDSCIIMWKINCSCVDVMNELGGDSLDPYLTLIEGGASGFIYNEMQDFYYYALILHQGDQTMLERVNCKTLSTCEVPDLMRALGYYPSNYEIDNMIYELTLECGDAVTFEDFVKLYVNHRPCDGVSADKLTQALTVFAKMLPDGQLGVEKEDLYAAMEDCGEVMDHEEVDNYLRILHHDNEEKNTFPAVIPVSEFVKECLGVDENITEEDVHKIIHMAENEADT